MNYIKRIYSFIMGYIYLLESSNDDGTIYKIGYTKKDVKKRIGELQTGNPYAIKEVCNYKTKYNQRLEKSLHNFYSHNKVKNEWFKLDISDVVNFVNTCQSIENNLDYLKDNYFIDKMNKKLNYF